jgi:hypothetical protein
VPKASLAPFSAARLLLAAAVQYVQYHSHCRVLLRGACRQDALSVPLHRRTTLPGWPKALRSRTADSKN